MIYKCPNCNGALEYNPAEDKMHCAHCGNDYFMWELDEDAVEYHQELPTQSEIEEKKLDFAENRTIYDEPEFIECKVYTCSTCGAELSVSNVEVSTYCAYCGQPTIIYNRVDKTRKPKYILPFKITKEDAEIAIREELIKGFFIPSKVKEFEAERISGIYLPYFLFDVSFYHKVKVSYGKNSKEIVEGDCNFVRLRQDASKPVEDELSYALEPYDLTELQEFEPGYLSGFYADRFDISEKQLTKTVGRRCKQMFDDEIVASCKGRVEELYDFKPVYEITKADYAFLPVWFMTFRYKEIPYTMMVNGQTGKVVGTVPFHKTKVVITFLLILSLFSAPLIGFGFWIKQIIGFGYGGILIWVLWIFLMLSTIFIASVIKKYKKIRANLEYARNRKTEDFVKERQEKS